MNWVLVFRLLALLIAGSAFGAGLVRIYQWFPLRKRVGLGPCWFFAGVVASAAASLYYRLDALTAHSPFSPRDALSTVILGLFLLGLGAAPMVLAEVEEGEHRE